MMEFVIGFSYATTISIVLFIIYLMLYFLLFLCGKIMKKNFLNNNLLRIRYVLTFLPFFFCGLYILSIIFVINDEFIVKALFGIFGLFLIIYSIYKIFRKIKDIEYFGGVE